jgi:hypothetical protein
MVVGSSGTGVEERPLAVDVTLLTEVDLSPHPFEISDSEATHNRRVPPDP